MDARYFSRGIPIIHCGVTVTYAYDNQPNFYSAENNARGTYIYRKAEWEIFIYFFFFHKQHETKLAIGFLDYRFSKCHRISIILYDCCCFAWKQKLCDLITYPTQLYGLAVIETLEKKLACTCGLLYTGICVYRLINIIDLSLIGLRVSRYCDRTDKS